MQHFQTSLSALTLAIYIACAIGFPGLYTALMIA